MLTTFLLASTLLATSALAQEQDTPAQSAEETPAQTGPEPAATAETELPAQQRPAAPGFSEKVLAAIGKPAAGKALVVFFRPSKFVGSAIGFKVRENEVELGKLRNGNYFTLEVEPGPHAYVVHSEAKDVTNIEAESGETYFLSASIGMGFIAGRPNLSPSDVSAFGAVVDKLKKSKPLD